MSVSLPRGLGCSFSLQLKNRCFREKPNLGSIAIASIAGTEFVVVEDVSCFDTNAVILKGTTVLTYKPRFVDRPFSGSLFGIEVRIL